MWIFLSILDFCSIVVLLNLCLTIFITLIKNILKFDQFRMHTAATESIRSTCRLQKNYTKGYVVILCVIWIFLNFYDLLNAVFFLSPFPLPIPVNEASIVSRSCYWENIYAPSDECMNQNPNAPSAITTEFCETCSDDGCNNTVQHGAVALLIAITAIASLIFFY